MVDESVAANGVVYTELTLRSNKKDSLAPDRVVINGNGTCVTLFVGYASTSGVS